MKYLLASLLAVGLIGGSQVVASGQESEVEETNDTTWEPKADHKALDWIVANARGAKDIGSDHPLYKPDELQQGKKQERESATQRRSCVHYETPEAIGACYANTNYE